MTLGSESAYHGVRVLVTGATGFIGRAVARRLAVEGAALSVAVRPSSPVDDGGIPDDAEVLEWSGADPRSVRATVEKARPSVVFNLAGYGVARDERDPESARTINADLPARLARALARSASSSWEGLRIVHTGSALEYGEIGGRLEEDGNARPETLYGRTKLAGTQGLAAALRDIGMTGLTARLFTVYGPGERPGRLLPDLLECAASGERIELSAGSQSRDFTYVEDVAEGLLRLAAHGGDAHRIVNLATGRLTTVREFGETAARVLGIPADRLDWGALPTRQEEMRHEPVAVERLRTMLGWVPSTSIEDGIRATAEARGL